MAGGGNGAVREWGGRGERRECGWVMGRNRSEEWGWAKMYVGRIRVENGVAGEEEWG